MNYEHLIVLGDFNGTVNNHVDRSTSEKKRKIKSGKLPDSFFKLVEDEGLIDVWRKRNAGNKDYTFYSNRHGVRSRIDMIWISKELELYTNKVDILPRGISDHNPIIWKTKTIERNQKTWRINENQLDKQDLVDQLKKDLHEYLIQQKK